MFDYRFFRGLIRGKGYSEGTFAKKIGITRQSFSNKVRNVSSFTQDEMLKTKIFLNLSDKDLVKCFFTKVDEVRK